MILALPHLHGMSLAILCLVVVEVVRSREELEALLAKQEEAELHKEPSPRSNKSPLRPGSLKLNQMLSMQHLNTHI